jgi:hypothetical protein
MDLKAVSAKTDNLRYLSIPNANEQPSYSLFIGINSSKVGCPHVICLPRDSTSTCETSTHSNQTKPVFLTNDWIQVSLTNPNEDCFSGCN